MRRLILVFALTLATVLAACDLLPVAGIYYVSPTGNDANPGTFSRQDLNKIVATCKCLSPTLGHDIARHGMIYHGGFGYTKDTPLEMMLRGIMSYEVGAEGGLNIMRGIICRDEFGDEFNSFKD